ncbi:uncharacterized protein K02A2.6-like [Ixodes scapularis]|uniref:uncharacterized protein K02A2.6-like n=1 Tax=Ixodes scapularis TaxID=6945 RepID=UPI001C3856B8|nr:uncharacterized protein K02A2.6-like [Ixodes scapularis]
MPHLGKVLEFDEASQSFETYVECFELFVAANSIKEEKKAVTFLTVIGDRTYEVLKNLAAPDLPGSKTYSEIKTLLEEHYGPQRSVIAERCRFNQRSRLEHESVEDFILALKSLSRFCNFGTFLQSALRDRLVAGLRDEETQKELFAFAEEKLTFAAACKIAREKEAAAKQTADMHKESKAVNAIHKKVSPPENRGHGRSTSHDHGSSTSLTSCYRCGNEHEPRDCRFKTYRCKICYKTGHLRKMCRNTPGKTPERNVQILEESDDEDEDLLTVYTCTKSSPGFKVFVEVDRVPLLMLIDTGAAVSIIPEEVFIKHFPQKELLETKVALRTYSGERLSVKGKISVKVQYNGQEETLDLFVVASEGRSPPVLLGRDWLRKLKLDWTAICSITVQDQVEQLRKKYPNVFDSSPGMVRDHQAQVVIKENSTPVFRKARPVPLPLKEAVTAQLRKLEKDGILRHVSQSDWATPLVVKHAINGDKTISIRTLSEEATTNSTLVVEAQLYW